MRARQHDARPGRSRVERWPASSAPHPRQPDPHEAVHGSQPGTSSRGTLQHADLVAQSQVLQLKGRARTENRGQGGDEHRERNGHRRRIKESIIPFPSDVLRFSRGTGVTLAAWATSVPGMRHASAKIAFVKVIKLTFHLTDAISRRVYCSHLRVVSHGFLFTRRGRRLQTEAGHCQTVC